MTADNYRTVFELGFRSFPWSTVSGPLLFIGISFLLIKLSRFVKRKTLYFATGVFVGSIATIIFVVLLITIVPDFLKLRNAYVSGKSQGRRGCRHRLSSSSNDWACCRIVHDGWGHVFVQRD